MKAIGLFSGGLDSILAADIMKRERWEVLAVYFYHGFNGSVKRELAAGADWSWSPPPQVTEAAQRIGVELIGVDVSREFTGIILHPAHGWGTGANPCIDCKIFFLARARTIMEREGAELVFTGEVVGQRPMSQHKPMLKHIERASGLEGRLLRPLSAKLLDPTIPEREGLVNRDRLYAFSGRSRKPQMELARQFDIDFYPSSGGGCHLTEKSFGNRLKDLVSTLPDRDPTPRELLSLKTGRHLRLPGGTRVIVGRNETENDHLTGLLGETAWRFHVADAPGAEVFALGEPSDGEYSIIAAICARYSKAKDAPQATVHAERGNEKYIFDIKPAQPDDISHLIIE